MYLGFKWGGNLDDVVITDNATETNLFVNTSTDVYHYSEIEEISKYVSEPGICALSVNGTLEANQSATIQVVWMIVFLLDKNYNVLCRASKAVNPRSYLASYNFDFSTDVSNNVFFWCPNARYYSLFTVYSHTGKLTSLHATGGKLDFTYIAYSTVRGFNGIEIEKFIANYPGMTSNHCIKGGSYNDAVALVPDCLLASKRFRAYNGDDYTYWAVCNGRTYIQGGNVFDVYTFPEGFGGQQIASEPSAYIQVENGPNPLYIVNDNILSEGQVRLSIVVQNGTIQGPVFWSGLPTEEPFGWSWGDTMNDSIYNDISNITQSKSYPISATVTLVGSDGKEVIKELSTVLYTKVTVQPNNSNLSITKTPNKSSYSIDDVILLKAVPSGFTPLSSDSFSWSVDDANYTTFVGDTTTDSATIRITLGSAGIKSINVKCMVPDANGKLYVATTPIQIINGTTIGGGESTDGTQITPGTVVIEPGYLYENVISVNYTPGYFGINMGDGKKWDSKYVENYHVTVLPVHLQEPFDTLKKAIYANYGPYGCFVKVPSTGLYDYIPASKYVTTDGVPGKYKFVNNKFAVHETSIIESSDYSLNPWTRISE